MKVFVSLFLVVAFLISSCSDNQRNESANAKDSQDSATPTAVQKLQIPVDGMTCSACQARVKRTVKELEGVKDVEVSLKDRTAIVTYIPSLIKPERIQQAIADIGYTAGEPKEIK